MTGFTDVFGGSTLQASQVAFRAVALSANVTLVWPQYSTSATDYVARIMNVTPSTSGLAITMPDATEVSAGQDVFVNNLGANTFNVLDAAGGVITSVAAGTIQYLYLTNNSTAAGTWTAIVLGVGSANLSAGQLAGLGLKAISNTLAFAPVVSTFSASQAVTAANRANVLVWTGGSGTLTLPAINAVEPDWLIEVRNDGTGTLTLQPVGGDLIDDAASIALQVTESCFVHSGPSAWYTVGRGRSTQFNFTKLTKSVTGGTTTLTLTEAANVVQQYSGALVSNETVVVPSVVQVYYIINGTSGAHTFTVKTAVTGGATVSVDSGTAAILFCDGTNIINCTTSGVAIPNPVLPVGSAGSPSMSFLGDLTTGIYQPSSGTFAITISGTQRLLVTSTGLNNTAVGTTTPSTGAFTTLSSSGNASVGGTLGVTGATTLSSTLAVTGAATLSSTLAVTGAITATGGVVGALTGNASTATILATGRTISITGDVTYTSGTFNGSGNVTGAGTIANSAVTLAKIANAAANSKLLGSGAAGSGSPYAEITLGTNLSMSGTTLNAAGGGGGTGTVTSVSVATANGFSGTVANPTTTPAITLTASGSITASGYTMTTGKLLGRNTAATGAVELITLGTNLSMTGTTLNATGSAPSYGLVTGSDFTTTSTTLVDITGLSIALLANSTYLVGFALSLNGATSGFSLGVNYSAAGAAVEASMSSGNTTSPKANRVSALNTAYVAAATSGDGMAILNGIVTTGVNAGNLTAQMLTGNGASTAKCYINSALTAVKLA